MSDSQRLRTRTHNGLPSQLMRVHTTPTRHLTCHLSPSWQWRAFSPRQTMTWPAHFWLECVLASSLAVAWAAAQPVEQTARPNLILLVAGEKRTSPDTRGRAEQPASALAGSCGFAASLSPLTVPDCSPPAPKTILATMMSVGPTNAPSHPIWTPLLLAGSNYHSSTSSSTV